MAVVVSRGLKQSFYGDFISTSDGMLDVTTSIEEAIIDIVINRVKAVLDDWEFMRTPANLDYFIGEPNTRDTAAEIELNVKESLEIDPITDLGSFNVRVVPISRDGVVIFITNAELNIELEFGFTYTGGFQFVRR